MQKFIVSNDKAVYEAWPDVVLTDSGKLVCVFSECTSHLDRENARLMITTSTDRGRTWAEKKPLTEKGQKKDFFNCARISKLNDGRLAIVCDRVKNGELNDHKNQTVEEYIWFSSDDGETWSDPKILPFGAIVPDRLLQLKCGRILLCAHFRNFDTDKSEEYLWYSDDLCQTWSDRIIIASDPRYNLCETNVIECEDGTLVAFLRENSFRGYDMMKAISYDKGETWEGVYNMPIPGGHRPTAGFLNDGNIFITYRYMPSIPWNMQTTLAAYIKKEDLLKKERSDQQIRIMPIDYDRNKNPDNGYTGWVQFPDGEIYVVNYIKDDSDKAQIRGYSFYPDDIVL